MIEHEPHISLPRHLTPSMLAAVRSDPTTSVEDKDEEHRRIGWLLCAWDVIVASYFNCREASLAIVESKVDPRCRHKCQGFPSCPPGRCVLLGDRI